MKIRIAKGGLKFGTWNHRVIRHEGPRGSWLAIHEVHYDAEGKVVGWAGHETAISGENLDELQVTLERMLRALKRPILTIVKRGMHKTLVEMRPGSKEAQGKPISKLSEPERAELEGIKEVIEKRGRKGTVSQTEAYQL